MVVLIPYLAEGKVAHVVRQPGTNHRESSFSPTAVFGNVIQHSWHCHPLLFQGNERTVLVSLLLEVPRSEHGAWRFYVQQKVG